MKKFLMILFVVLTAVFQACDNHDDLWSAIDDLNGRVQTLETQVKALNGNIEALQKLYDGATINSVSKQGDKYVITLSNGEVIELAQGSQAEAVVPLMGITDDGYWQYSVDNGASWICLDVKATASDGKTPQFRVDETTGYWQVSYDGTEWTNVKNTQGEPVKAVGEGTVTDKFFESVSVENGMLRITLRDPAGTTLRIPILPDFLCRITVTQAGVQTFAAGESRMFPVEIKGVDDVTLFAPDGWTVGLSAPVENAAQLTVTAPATVSATQTRAAADNTKDVAILALANGYSTIAKIEVELGAVVTSPTVTVGNSTTVEPTVSTLDFDVTASDAQGWKYLFRKSSQTAPDAAAIMADGTAGTGTGVALTGLEAATEYTLYVVAYAGDLLSEVKSARNTTLAAAGATDYYQEYLDGKDLTIAGVTYNRSADGDPVLVTAENAADFRSMIVAKTSAVLFIDTQTVDMPQSVTPVTGRIVIVGRTEGEKPLLQAGACWQLASGSLVLKNLKIDMTRIDGASSTNANYLFNNAKATADGFEVLGVEDCEILHVQKPFYTASVFTAGIGRMVFSGNKIQFEAATTNLQFINIYNTLALWAYKQFTFENNTLYAASPMMAQIFQWNHQKAAEVTVGDWGMAATISNNTFVNVVGTNIYAKFYKAASLTARRNIFYADGAYAQVSYLYAFYAADAAPAVDISDNIAYGLADGRNWSNYNSASTVTLPADNTIVKYAENPFAAFDAASGVFTPIAALVGYGAQQAQ